MAMAPDQQDIFFILIVSGGAGAGEFVYDAAGNLRSSNVGQPTTDPVQGISCPQGFATYNGHGAVINLLSTANGAFFQYQDLGTSTQGPLILVVASTSGTDPVDGTAYGAGMTGIDPAFGDSVVTVGANIGLNQVAYTRQSKIAAVTGSGAVQPKIQIDAPEQTQASHMQMWLAGESPDASKPAQFIVAAVAGAGVLAPLTTIALTEIQGALAVGPAAANIELWLAPSGDTTGAKDKTALNGALSSFKTVHLLPGTYFVNGPVVVPSGVSLLGPFPSSGTPGENFGAGGLPLQGAVITAVAAFAGAAVISLPTPVPNTTQGGGQVLKGFTVDGSSLPGGNTVNGIQGLGFIAAVTMRDVLVYKTGGDGLFISNDGVAGHNPDGFDVAYCKFALCGGSGAHLITLTDSVFTVVECSGNGVSGWRVDTGFNTRFISCGGDSNGGTPGAGFEFIGGFGGYTGAQFLHSCSSELNKLGYSVTSTGGKVYLLNCIAGSNTTAPFNYSGTTTVSSSASFNTSTVSPTLNGGPVWQAMSPLAAGFAAGSPGPRFELEGILGNRVRLTGLISLTANQVAGTTFFTLPAGFRPATDKHVAVRSNFGGGLLCLVDILATGALVIQTAGSTGQLFSLDSVSVELD